MSFLQHLAIDQYGAYVGKHRERLKITKGKKILAESPLLYLETVTIANRGVSISAAAWLEYYHNSAEPDVSPVTIQSVDTD
jgi:hypothetical protein